jgi:hypothetical protein
MEVLRGRGYRMRPTCGGTTGTIASAALVKKNGGSLVASPPISLACSA